LLFENDKFDNAGYHYGFSAECALKGAMERVGLILDEVKVDGRDAFYIHFPELKRISMIHAGRLSQKIAGLLAKAQFLQAWHIKMRYAPDGSVSKPQCETWRKQTYDAVLIDARAGLSELAAGPLLALGATTLVFGVKQNQTFEDFRFLFSYLSRMPHPSEPELDWRRRFRFVHAKADPQDDDQETFKDKLYNVLADEAPAQEPP